MGEVHQLILREGLEGARARAETRAERQAIEAAGLVLSEEVSRLGITHAGFAMTSLPHKRIEEPLWRSPGAPHNSPCGIGPDRKSDCLVCQASFRLLMIRHGLRCLKAGALRHRLRRLRP
jgi:hypothetical protein